MHIGSQLLDLAPFRGLSGESPSWSSNCAARVSQFAGSISAAVSASATAPRTPPEPTAYAALVREIFGTLDCRSGIRARPGAVRPLRIAGPPGRLHQGRRDQAVRHHRRGDERPDPPRALRGLARHRAGAAAGAGAALAPADVVGPVCETGDTFATERDLPPLGRRRSRRLDQCRRLWRGDEFDLQQPASGARGAGLGRPVCRDPAAAELRRDAGDGFGPGMAERARRRRGSIPASPLADPAATCPAEVEHAEPFRPEDLLVLRMRLARAALLWERVWPACLAGTLPSRRFRVVVLFDLLPGLPGIAHAAILALIAVAVAAAAVWGMRTARRGGWPDMLAARRRIEQASGLPHRPLLALSDRPSAPLDESARLLWAAHQRRMAAVLRRLRVGWPIAGLARRDPWGLRSMLAILLLLAVIDAGADWRDRAFRAFQPSFAGSAASLASSFELWVSPPEYTGLAPQFLRADVAETVPVAIGSMLLGQVHGGGECRVLRSTRQAGFHRDRQAEFPCRAEADRRQGAEPEQGGSLLGRWPIQIVPDNPPVIAFADPPSATPRAALHIDYRASDDYGVASAKAVIRRPTG